MLRPPPLQTLLAFESAARLSSFSRAALELCITQSAVSHQIQQLESWAGQQLFRRVGRGVVLTDAGELFGKTVGEMLRLLSDVRNRIEPYANPDSVIVYSPPSFAHGVLTPALPKLRAEYPSLEVWIVTQHETSEIDQIDVDLIVASRGVRSPDLHATPLLQDSSLAICGAEAATTLSSLAFPEVLQAAPLLTLESDPDWAPWLPDLRRNGVQPLRAITCDDPHILLDAASMNMGIAMLSRIWARREIAKGQLVVLDQIPSVELPPLSLWRSSGTLRSPMVDVVHAWLLDVCSDDI
jgi:LysR family transcriptional regulator, glycine cleavage system transcriptional activator